jgi:hypothetical protein
MIKLKHLVENATETAYAPLTKEEKIKLRETIKAYNQYRKALKAENVYATANKIMEAVNLAERYALKECNEWMEAKMVERDMKEIKKSAAKLYEEAHKIKSIEQQLEMLYEEVGVRLERYFEIADPIQEAPKAYQTQTDRVPVSLEPNFPEDQQAAGQDGQVVK